MPDLTRVLVDMLYGPEFVGREFLSRGEDGGRVRRLRVKEAQDEFFALFSDENPALCREASLSGRVAQ